MDKLIFIKNLILVIIIFCSSLFGQHITAPYLFPEDILKWSSDDIVSQYNVSSVPLAERFTNPNTRVNPFASNDEMKFMTIPTMSNSISKSPAQYGDSFNIYAFSFWQYIDLIIYWGGSAAEGIIVPPTAEVTDAAHRNGVQILGTLFFPPVHYGGDIKWLDQLLTKENEKFPIADKMIEMAEYFKFDGWFINQETHGTNPEHAELMLEFIEYIKMNSNLYVMWYDAMTIDGKMEWQGQLTNKNYSYISDEESFANSMFVDFRWKRNENSITNTLAFANEHDYNPFDLYFGIEVHANGEVDKVPYKWLFDKDNPSEVSLGFFNPDLIYSSSKNMEEFYNRENKLWSGINGDPSKTKLDNNWPGTAHLVEAKSVITKLPFTTSFNTGHGKKFFVDGKVYSSKEWYNRSIQDILPTWRWLIEGNPKTVSAQFNWSDSYIGGSSIELSGKLLKDNQNEIKLYKTKLEISENTKFELTFKQNQKVKIKVGLSFWKSESQFKYFDISDNRSNQWITKSFSLEKFKDNKIAQISILLSSESDIEDVSVNLGNVTIADETIKKINSPKNFVVEKFIFNDAYSARTFLKWENSSNDIFTNHIFRLNENKKLEYIASTPNNVIHIPAIERRNGETKTKLFIQSIGKDFQKSELVVTELFWGNEPPNNPPNSKINGPYFTSTKQKIVLDASRSTDREGKITKYEWILNDEVIGNSEKFETSFSQIGTFDLILKVTDEGNKFAYDTTYLCVQDAIVTLTPDILYLDFEDLKHESNEYNIIYKDCNQSEGIFGKALLLDGNNSYGMKEDFKPEMSTFTIALWAFAKSRPSWASFVKNWAGAPGAFHLGLMNNDGDLELQVSQSNGKVLFLREGKENKFPLKEWQFISFVANGEDIILYRNGIEVDREKYDGTLKTSFNKLGIGAKPSEFKILPKNTAGLWDGMLDEIKIYSRALNASEIKKLHSKSKIQD
ncbi:MAG: hypothetical protein JEY94_13450 [Melioribacteraceae bacterium]|nr:hypothetical protein [Melioribacteraceae bacterium]